MEKLLTTASEALEIRPSPEKKGLGVFARRAISENEKFIVPMFGVRAEVSCYETSLYGVTGYFCDEFGSPEMSEEFALDGDPAHFQEDPALQFGSRVNEACPEEQPNAVLMLNPFLYREDVQTDKILLIALVCIVKSLEPGEEVLYNYGPTFHREYEVNPTQITPQMTETAYDAVEHFIVENSE